jgi:PAS domain S-box-containing protein
MKVRTQLIALISFLFLIFAVAFFLIRAEDKKEAVLLFRNESTEKKDVFDKLLRLQSHSAYVLAYDYTYWDEMVDFIKAKDPVWAGEMMSANTLSTYQVNSIWVYDPEASLVYSFSDPEKQSPGTFPVPSDVIPGLFEKGPLAHFFAPTPQGLWEVRGASVHPSSDPERKTRPAGYFFNGKVWDAAYLEGLEELVGAKIRLLPADSLKNSSDIFDSENAAITFFKPLKSWDGQTLMFLEVKIQSQDMQAFNQRSRKYLILFFLFAAMVIGIIAFFSVTSIGIPLTAISKALASGSATFLFRIRKSKTEFGAIALLIEKFFEQKRRLTEEIAERERVEWQVRHAAQEWEKTFDSISDMIFLLDKDYRLVRANKAVFDFFKVKPEQLLGRKCYELVHHMGTHPENCPFHATLQDKLSHTQEEYTFDGIPVLATVSPVFDEKGEVVGAVHIAKDMTELKKAEAELQKQRDLSQRYFEVAKAIMVVLDQDGNVTMINQAGCDILGYTKEEVIGKNWFDRFIPGDIGASLKPFFREIAEGRRKMEEAEYHENPVLRKDGTQRMVAWHNALIKNEQQQVTAILSFGEDITDRANYEKNLQGKVEELEKFKKIAVDRELKMIELKEKLKALEGGREAV